MRLIIFFMLVTIVQACTVTKTVYTENIFNSWIGHSAQELMLQQGSPAKIVSDGNGGQIYVYDKSSIVTVGYSSPGRFYTRPAGVAVPGYQATQLNYQPGATISNQFVSEKKIEYFVNSDGYIYSWRSVGYPKTYTQRYTKEELKLVDESLFMPPASKTPQFTLPNNTNYLDTALYNYSGYKRKGN